MYMGHIGECRASILWSLGLLVQCVCIRGRVCMNMSVCLYLPVRLGL